MKKKICVAVAAHKSYEMPRDPAYLPVHVGAALHPDICKNYQQDNDGENISALNGSYSELTAMYWLWKNKKTDVKGLVHYRRLLGSSNPLKRVSRNPLNRVVSGEEIEALIDEHEVILPKKRKYFIESVYDHYAHTHCSEHLEVCRCVLTEKAPDHVPAWDMCMKSTSLHICNMFIMRGSLFDEYCSWLFPLLEDISTRIDSTGMSQFEARWPGRISELLLDPWITTNGYEYVELPVVNPEPVDWLAKIRGFLRARYSGEKYKKSF